MVEMNITSEQSRAARCYLDWSRDDLARASGVSPETIKNFEPKAFSPNISTKAALLKVFEAEGLEFVEDGIRRKHGCPRCGYPSTPAKEAHEQAATPQV
jgi:DNA-binding XRE family transcriptional regulator